MLVKTSSIAVFKLRHFHFLGYRQINEDCDIFSIGVLLLFLLNGKYPSEILADSQRIRREIKSLTCSLEMIKVLSVLFSVEEVEISSNEQYLKLASLNNVIKTLVSEICRFNHIFTDVTGEFLQHVVKKTRYRRMRVFFLSNIYRVFQT